MASFGSERQQRRHPLPQVARNKISTHPDSLPTKIAERGASDSTHSETISKLISMSVPADPRMQFLRDKLRPRAVRTVKVAGFDGADVLVQLVDAEGEKAEIGRIPEHEVSMRRTEHPSELYEVGQEINAEEIGRWREGQLHLSARACESPALRSFLLAFEPGQVVAGTVSVVHDFGVFVHVDGEPDGL